MKKYLTKRNIYITLFTVLYLAVGIVSLIHSFAFFGLANSTIMSVMLGCCFEIGQVAVLMSLLTSKKEQSRVMPWVLMFICTAVQILGNIFSSYKYLMLHSTADLTYFRDPIFIWTDLPDDITTVIITYIVGAILPVIALCMTSMVSNYIMDTDKEDNQKLLDDKVPFSIIEDDGNEQPSESDPTEVEDEVQESVPELIDPIINDNQDEESLPEPDNKEERIEDAQELKEDVQPLKKNHFVNLKGLNQEDI